AEQFYNPVGGTVNGTDVPAFTVGGAGNPSLKPEKSTETEGGFDLGLFNDRLNIEYTHYSKTTRDALVNVNLAPSLGTATNRFQNLGRVKNWGDEGCSAPISSTAIAGSSTSSSTARGAAIVSSISAWTRTASRFPNSRAASTTPRSSSLACRSAR